MRRRSIILFIILFAFWLAISDNVDIQHVIFGAVFASITVWFWVDTGHRIPRIPSARALRQAGRLLVLLIVNIIKGNIDVAKTVLFSKPPARPVIVDITPAIKTGWGRVLLANMITLPPGTITVDTDPETGRFVVHALTEEAANDLISWPVIDEIIKLENLMQEGEGYAVDSRRDDNPDSISVSASDNRADGHRPPRLD
ncbi:MAG: Na+/H+ antiporter subunit E [Clostridiales bacterium]|jgi:multicomponent Na+:H+ antiporter subunit E|nr:Na+/H+ antiporter subunit E [Clostridiales bacterium]